MGHYLKKLPEEEFQSEYILYEGQGIYITKTDFGVTFPCKGSHAHEGYEFVIPTTDMPFLEINDRKIFGKKDRILPINPWQVHGVSQRMENIRFLDIFVNEDYMRNLNNDMFIQGQLRFHMGDYYISGQLQTLLRMFMEEAASNYQGKDVLLEHISCSIVLLLLREVNNNMVCKDNKLSSKYTNRINLVIHYMQEHYNRDCSVKDLAEIAGMSRYHFIRVFKMNTGLTPYEYLLSIRIEKTKKMILDTNLSITEICSECGINNVSRLTRLFKERTGVTPSYFRSMMR